MVDSIKNYGITGVNDTVEIGKIGVKISGSDSNISLRSKNGDLISANIGTGTGASNPITLEQLQDAEKSKIQVASYSVTYNSGEVELLTVPANTVILSTTVEKGAGNWTGYDSTTEITVGDSAVNDRLYRKFDPTHQTVINTKWLYTEETTINAYITPGPASSGTASITIMYSGLGEFSDSIGIGAEDPGQEAFTTPGTFTFTVPTGITIISAVAVGGGAGGGGGGGLNRSGYAGPGGSLSYGTFAVTPGETLTVVVGDGGPGNLGTLYGGSRSIVPGENSLIMRGDQVLLGAAGGSNSVDSGSGRDGGGSGGSGGGYQGGGGGAGGYTGSGGAGETYYPPQTGPFSGTGGGGGGGNSYHPSETSRGQSGGGVGILGQGANGAAGGQPGSGGAGNLYGGGGGGAGSRSNLSGGDGGQGAVRIIWGDGRSYPSTNTQDV